MTARPTLGVVVPLFRVEEFVAETIASIAAQTVRPDVVVLVDDASPDRSAAVALDASRAAGLPTHLVRHATNQGLSAARNSGMAALDRLGPVDLVWFCDSDDTVEPELVERLVDAIVGHDADLAAARTRLVTREGEHLGVMEPSSPDVVCPGSEYARRILVNEARGYACNKVFRRELFDGVEFPVGITYEDVPVLVRLALRARRVALVDDPLYRYTTNEASISRRFGEHTVDLFHQEDLVVDLLREAGLVDTVGEGAGRWKGDVLRYRYEGVLLPVVNMALRRVAADRADGGTPPDVRRTVDDAVARVRARVRARDVTGLWRAGARRPAVAAAVLAASPRAYAAVLRRR